MTRRHLGHRRLSLVVTLVAAFCLLFAGMRVPDPSRPHRPKPSQRAVMESQAKSPQSGVKKSLEFVAALPSPLEFSLPLPRSADSSVTSLGRGVSPIFPNASRAPPVVLS